MSNDDGPIFPVKAGGSLTTFLDLNLPRIQAHAAERERGYVKYRSGRMRFEAIERRAHADLLGELRALVADGTITVI